MKKFVVRCDLEGASGIVSYVQAEPWQAEYQDGRRYFMSDLLALLKGLDDGGADVIQVYDEHCYGRNILLDQIPDTYRADISFFCGKPDYTRSWAGGLDRETTGLILLGFHSKAGTHVSEREALLHHSYDKNISDIQINGHSVGEIGMEAAIAGCFQVPLLLFTGDSAGAEEAQSIAPGCLCVCVKESCDGTGGECLSVPKAHRRIYQAARQLAESPPMVAPFVFPAPVELKMSFYSTEYGGKFQTLFPGLTLHGASVLECWAEYLARKARLDAIL